MTYRRARPAVGIETRSSIRPMTPRILIASLFLLASQAVAQPVLVEIQVQPPVGAVVGLRGDTPPLTWDRSLPMEDPDGDGVYSLRVEFPEGAGPVSYKAVIEGPGDETTWEQGGNRLLFPGRMNADRRAFDGAQRDLPMLLLTPGQMKEDTQILRSAITSLHPGRLLHNSQEDLDRIYSRLDQGVAGLADRYPNAIPLPEFYLQVVRAVASIKDGHTQVSMYNQGEYLTATLYNRSDRVPFSFRLIGTRMVVTGDATQDEVLPRGTEVLSLDGRPVSEVIEALMAFASADGSNDAKRLDELEISPMPAPAQRFDVIYGLLYPATGKLELTVRRPGESESRVEVERITQDLRLNRLRGRDPALPRSSDDLFRWRMVDKETAYLYIGTFATFSLGLDYQAWLLETFREINASGARNLVVDLRDVSGGMDDAAALLLRHLVQKPVEVSQWRGHTAYRKLPEALSPYVRSWSNDFYDWTSQVTDSGNGRYLMAPRSAITVTPANDGFKGNVAVLVDATASSATFYLAKAIKEGGVAPLIGQETGGNLKGLNAGLMAFLTLPNSGIVVDLPLLGSRPPVPGPDRGITPDVPVEPLVEAIADGRDLELEAALTYFQRQK